MKEISLTELEEILLRCEIVCEKIVINEDTPLKSLKIDSLSACELLFEIEKTYQINISFTIFLQIQTVGDFISCINNLLNKHE